MVFSLRNDFKIPITLLEIFLFLKHLHHDFIGLLFQYFFTTDGLWMLLSVKDIPQRFAAAVVLIIVKEKKICSFTHSVVSCLRNHVGTR